MNLAPLSALQKTKKKQKKNKQTKTKNKIKPEAIPYFATNWKENNKSIPLASCKSYIILKTIKCLSILDQ